MNSEKTEKATPKRRREAREKGRVVKSSEMSAAIVLLLLYLGFKLLEPTLGENFVLLMKDFLVYFSVAENFEQALGNLFIQSFKYFLMICGPILAISLISGVVVNYLQIGFLFQPKLLSVKPERINPLSGFKRIFSLKAIVDMLKAVLKLLIVGTVVYLEYEKSLVEMPNYINVNFSQVIQIIWNILTDIIWKSGLIFLVLGLFDYVYQWWQHEKSIKMSKEEIKQEYKLLEGDPKIKAKIKETQRRMGMRRMMQQVPHADVVITNPTHYAIALKYDESKNSAPIVTAKGRGYIALKIKEEARTHKVYIAENPPLARALYSSTEIDRAIPEDLYYSVAKILAIVYRARGAV